MCKASTGDLVCRRQDVFSEAAANSSSCVTRGQGRSISATRFVEQPPQVSLRTLPILKRLFVISTLHHGRKNSTLSWCLSGFLGTSNIINRTTLLPFTSFQTDYLTKQRRVSSDQPSFDYMSSKFAFGWFRAHQQRLRTFAHRTSRKGHLHKLFSKCKQSDSSLSL